MKKVSFLLIGLVGLMLILGCGAWADMVGPADLQSPGAPGDHTGPSTGWVLGTQAGQTIGNTPITGFVVGPQVPPAGLASFKMQTGYDDADPLEKIYLGTNNYSGIMLKDITEFKYWTFLVSRDYGASGSPNGQPPMLEIMTNSAGDNETQQRVFVYKPYGQYGNNNVALSIWQEWDVMAAGGRWEMLQTGHSDYYGDWNWVINRYTNADPLKAMKLKAPYVGDYTQYYSSDGTYHLYNESGTSIAIKIGSGKAQDSRYGAWWRESCGINAYVDKLVIAYNERDAQGNLTGNNIRTVYDFDDGTTQPVAATCIRSVFNLLERSSSVQNNRLFVLFGKMLPTGYQAGKYFTIDDGSGPIRVVAPGHEFPAPSEFDTWFMRVEGRLGWAKVSDGPPPVYVRCINSRPDLIYKYE